MILEEVLEYANELTLEEKEVFLEVFKNRITEERREQIYQSYLQSKKELSEGKLLFSDDFNQLNDILKK